MLIRRLITLCVVIILLAVFPNYVFCEEYKSTIDYIQKTNKLWGISTCIINKDGSVTLVDSKDKGYGKLRVGQNQLAVNFSPPPLKKSGKNG